MTIGIAAIGPGAGLAVARALLAVEGVGRGSFGGFVSLVAIGAHGELLRAETQRGGMGTLFGDRLADIPQTIADAPVAGLMSSGPDRPEPLSQFTPAKAGVGLVTGHRMPNTVGASGLALNEETLALMEKGASPEEALDHVLAANPTVDAGMIALSVSGAIHLGNTEHVLKRADLGQHLITAPARGIAVAVMHNAILPVRPLAALAAEVALDVMEPQDRPTGWITLTRGTPVKLGSENAVVTDASGHSLQIVVSDPKFIRGQWDVGLGYQARVSAGGTPLGVMLYEPYMVVKDGFLVTVDGADRMSAPIRKE